MPEPTLTIDYNRYLYARADPLNLIDPSGHCVETPDDDDAGCWYLLQRLLYGENTRDIYHYEEARQWNAQHLQELIDYWDAHDHEALSPNAVLFGISGAVVLDTPLGFNLSGRLAVEYIGNYNSREKDFFIAAGGSLDFNLRKLWENGVDPLRVNSGKPLIHRTGTQTSIYLGDVHNLPTNGDYAGQSLAEETIVGYGLFSVAASTFHTPNQPSGPNGQLVGWAPSIGLNVGKSKARMRAFRLRELVSMIVDLVDGQ